MSATVDEALHADVTFASELADTPIDYFDVNPPPGIPARFATRRVRVRIESGRFGAPRSLDSQGFVLCSNGRGLIPDFHDEAALETTYREYVERLVQECTGARRVIVFDRTHRSSATTRRGGPGADAVVEQAHNDYSMQSGPERAREVLERLAPDEDPEQVLARRYSIVNVWRPTNGIVEDWPLALCDRRSIDANDIVAAELRWSHRTGRVAVLRYNPGQRWVYFPRMDPTEALVFSCFDTGAEDCRITGAHTAFKLPNPPTDARPRESLEVRTLALF